MAIVLGVLANTCLNGDEKICELLGEFFPRLIDIDSSVVHKTLRETGQRLVLEYRASCNEVYVLCNDRSKIRAFNIASELSGESTRIEEQYLSDMKLNRIRTASRFIFSLVCTMRMVHISILEITTPVDVLSGKIDTNMDFLACINWFYEQYPRGFALWVRAKNL